MPTKIQIPITQSQAPNKFQSPKLKQNLGYWNIGHDWVIGAWILVIL